MTVLRHVREGIGATRYLDHGAAFDAEITHHRRQGGKPGAPTKPASLPQQEAFPGWSDFELGMAVRMAAEGCTPGAIADEIISRSVSAQQVGSLLDRAQIGLMERPRKASAHRRQSQPSGQPAHRPRSITPEQEAAILGRRGKATIHAIATELGISEGKVRYVLSPQWGEP